MSLGSPSRQGWGQPCRSAERKIKTQCKKDVCISCLKNLSYYALIRQECVFYQVHGVLQEVLSPFLHPTHGGKLHTIHSPIARTSSGGLYWTKFTCKCGAYLTCAETTHCWTFPGHPWAVAVLLWPVSLCAWLATGWDVHLPTQLYACSLCSKGSHMCLLISS
jgi:hypothetical protein